MEPISLLAIAGTTTMLYNVGSYFYNYIYPEDDINNETIIKIEKELLEEAHNNVLDKVYQIKKSYDIDYEDVLRELRSVLEMRGLTIEDDNESNEEFILPARCEKRNPISRIDSFSSDSDLPIPFFESSTNEDE